MLLTALACGVILSMVASLPSFIKKSRLITKQQKTITELERTLATHTQKPETEALVVQAPDYEKSPTQTP